jgi:hypothetical protein
LTDLFQITLSQLDIAQILTGLDNRAEAWEKTAHFLEARESSEDWVPIEECSSAREARSIAAHYREIIAGIEAQLSLANEDESTETADSD